MIRRVLAGAALLAIPMCSLFPVSGWSQNLPGSRMTTIQIEYHEALPADGDMSAVRSKIYAQVQKDCEEAGKAFQMRCAVNSMNFNDPRSVMGQMPNIVVAHAQLTLFSDSKAAAGAPN
jgi:hypothetical protein